MESVRQDLLFAWRIMRRSPLFTLAAVASLALGLGANSAIFNVLDAVLLRSLPVGEPERLVVLRPLQDSRPQNFSYPQFRAIAGAQTSLEGLFAASDFPLPEMQARGRLVTGGYFRVLRARAWHGRVLDSGDDREDAPGAAVISYGFWQRYYGGQDVLGHSLQANRAVVPIVGVMGREFYGEKLGNAPDVYLSFNQQPLVMANDWRGARFAAWLTVMGRLKPGVTRERAQQELSVLYERFKEEGPSMTGAKSLRLEVEPGSQGLRELQETFRRPLWVLMGMVAMVLLIACANLATLLLERAQAREREMAVRRALGAGRGRLVRQLLTEGLLLSALGAAAGLLLARWGAPKLVQLASGDPPWQLPIGLNGRMVAFTTAVSVLATLLFALAPAWRASHPGSSRHTAGRSQRRWSRTFIVAQVALSVVLVGGAALLGRSFWNLLHQNFGLASEGVLTLRLPFEMRPGVMKVHEALRDVLEERLRQLPQVREAALSSCGPFDTIQHTGALSSPDEPMRQGDNVRIAHVSAGYFRTMGLQVLAGRGITAADRKETERVTVLSRSAARRFFPGEGPVGKLASFGRTFDPEKAVRVVGVVEDLRFASAREDFGIIAFTPLSQDPAPITSISVRTDGDPSRLAAPLRALVREAAPSLTVGEAVPFRAFIENSVRQERMMAVLALGFGALALLLAGIGVYGVVAYGAARRTQEFGIRMALGAREADVRALVLRDVAWLACIGCLLGTGAALASTRVLRNLLFGLAPDDAFTLALAAGTLAVVALAAAWWPARRAAQADPVAALRCE